MRTYKQLDLFAQCDIVNPAISAEQYQLQHAHYPISVKNPPGGPPEAIKTTKQYVEFIKSMD